MCAGSLDILNRTVMVATNPKHTDEEIDDIDPQHRRRGTGRAWRHVDGGGRSSRGRGRSTRRSSTSPAASARRRRRNERCRRRSAERRWEPGDDRVQHAVPRRRRLSRPAELPAGRGGHLPLLLARPDLLGRGGADRRDARGGVAEGGHRRIGAAGPGGCLCQRLRLAGDLRLHHSRATGARASTRWR